MVSIATLIVTNYTEYLEQCVNSSERPFLVFDGIEPIKGDYHYNICNAGRPSIARSVGVSLIGDFDFVQLLDSDDYLSDEYFDKVKSIVNENQEFDIFYTNYSIINEVYKFTHKEYVESLIDNNIGKIFKIKNPLIRTSVLKKYKFNEGLTCHEVVDLIYRVGADKCYHIPNNLQYVRVHKNNYNRKISQEDSIKTIRMIGEQTNG